MTDASGNHPAPRKRDAHTRIRYIMRNVPALGLRDRNGVSARTQLLALLMLADRADCITGEIPDRFVPTASEFGDVIVGDERTARRTIEALAEAGLIDASTGRGRLPKIRVRWPDEAADQTGQDARIDPGRTPDLQGTNVGQDARPSRDQRRAGRPTKPGRTPGSIRAGRPTFKGPTSGRTPDQTGQDTRPHPYVGSPVGSQDGITVDLPSAPPPDPPKPGEEVATGGKRARKSKVTAPAKAPAESTPVWEAYRECYLAANGSEPARNATTNSVILQLIRKLGVDESVRLIRDVFATPEVLRRYGSILAITKDPDAVRGAIAAAHKPRALTVQERDEARALYKQHPDHEISKRVAVDKRPPTYDEFLELRAYHAAGLRRRGGVSTLQQGATAQQPDWTAHAERTV